MIIAGVGIACVLFVMNNWYQDRWFIKKSKVKSVDFTGHKFKDDK